MREAPTDSGESSLEFVHRSLVSEVVSWLGAIWGALSGLGAGWLLHSTEASTEALELPHDPAAERRLLRQHTKLGVPHQTDIKTQT
jgi:hypothetical protein